MDFVFALDQRPHLLVRQRAAGARKRSTHEGGIIHPQARKILFVGERERFFTQNLAISDQMDSLVISNDAVEVKEDCLNHLWIKKWTAKKIRRWSPGWRDHSHLTARPGP